MKIETVIADVPGPDWSKIMDVIMLWIVGGRQRSDSEHEQLPNKAGFRLKRVIRTMLDVTILEGALGLDPAASATCPDSSSMRSISGLSASQAGPSSCSSRSFVGTKWRTNSQTLPSRNSASAWPDGLVPAGSSG